MTTNLPQTPEEELDQIFYRELRGKTVTLEQSHILDWAEKRLKSALLAWKDAAVVEARMDENNMAFLRILKIGTTQGLSSKLLVSYHDRREAEIKAHKGKE